MNEKRLAELIDAHLDGQLTAAEAEELSRVLNETPEARRLFWRQAAVHGLLQEATRLEWLQLADKKSGLPQPMRRQNLWAVSSWAWIPLMAAAAIVMIWWWAPWARSPATVASTAQALESEEFAPQPVVRRVATIVRMANIEWSDPTRALAVNAALEPGWLRLKSGLVHLEFFSGASVILQGPAEFEIRSEREAFCQTGRFRASVPEPARGFVVGSPNLSLVDLGTAFGMDVHADGGGEVFVFDGNVRLTRTGGAAAKQSLDKGQGVRVDRWGRVENTVAPSAAYATTAEVAADQESEAQLRYRQWQQTSAGLAREPAVLVHYDFEGQQDLDRMVANHATGAPAASAGTLVGCQWAQGRWPGKRALEYKGMSDRVRLDVPGKRECLTFLAWVRVDSLSHRYNALLVADTFRRGMLRWQLTQTGQLALTQLLVDDQPLNIAGSVQRVSSAPVLTPERMGQWVQLASVVDFSTGRVDHYLDGKSVGTGLLKERVPGQLGRVELGNWGLEPETEKGQKLARGGFLNRHFVGRIDEFALFSRALSAQEIERLYLDGQQTGRAMPSSRGVVAR